MSSTVSLGVVAAQVDQTEARLASIEAKLDQLVKALADHDETMKQIAKARLPSVHGFSMSNMLDSIRGILEREFSDHVPVVYRQ